LKSTILIGIFFLFSTIQHSKAGTPEDVHRIMHNSQNWMPKDYNKNLAAIETIGSPAVPVLIELLAEAEDQYAIGHICTALGRVPSAESLSHMQGYLHHSSWLVRSNCGESLATIHSNVGTPESELTTIFMAMTTDSNCNVRTNIASELGKTNTPLIKNWSVSQLDRRPLPDCNARVALSALANYPVEEYTGQLILSILEDSKQPLHIRESAAYALTKYHYAPAKYVLRQILQSPNPGGNVFSACIVALGKVGDSSDIELLQQMIERDPYNGQGVWSVKSKEAINNITISGP